MLKKKICTKVISAILSVSTIFVSTVPSFAESIGNVELEQKYFKIQNESLSFGFEEIKNISILQQNDNLIKYSFEKNGERYFAEEVISNTGANSCVESYIYKIDTNENKILISTEKTEVKPDENKISTVSRNAQGEITNSREDIYSDIVSNLTDEVPEMHYKSAKANKKIQYGVYKYNRTIRGYRNIRAYKYSVGILATIIASMVGGPAGAFFGVAAFLAGSAYGDIWTITKVYHKYNKNLRHRTKFVMSFYSDSARRHKVGPTSTYIEKGIR